MSQDDPFPFPFGDDDKTVIRRPSPGGRGRPEPTGEPAPPVPLGEPTYAPPPPPPPPPPPADFDLDRGRGALLGENPVVAAALSLLSLASRLQNTVAHRDIYGLQQQLVGEITAFRNKLLQQGMTQDQTYYACYVLCALLDESILNTPWGSQSFWGQRTLSGNFFKQTYGGEQFFPITDSLMRQPAQNLYLIELCYLCISLGFQGKYRIMQNGPNELEKYRQELYQLIQRVRGDYERALSPRWQGLKDVRNALMRFVPMWVVAVVVAAILFLAYLGFLYSISGLSDQTLSHLASLGREKIKTAEPLPPPVVKPPVPGRVERFKTLLADEIGRNMVEVVDDRTLRVRNSFASGSDVVKEEFVPMLKKIAQELGAGKDTVLVTGHTDDVPIRSARFPSNWDLSNARAKHVADILLENGALSGKISSKGRADGEPLVPNDSPEHRALNRRVDILIQ